MADRGWRELEALLGEPPGVVAFRALCAHLDRWPGDDREGAIDHAEDTLTTWPDAARVAPWSWGMALRLGHTKPTWRLVRRLERDPGHNGKVATPLCAIVGAPELAALTRFELDDWPEDDLATFTEHASRWTVRAVSLRGAHRHSLASCASHPVWAKVEELHVCSLRADTFHAPPPSLVPLLPDGAPLRELTIRADDLVELLAQTRLPHLRRLAVFVLSPGHAEALARRPELAGLEALTLLFRCDHDGRSSFEPILGHTVPASDEAAEIFFRTARLDALRELTLLGRSSGYWTREGNGPRTVEALLRARVLPRLERLRLELLPLGDDGLAPLVPELGARLRTLELVNLYAQDATANALAACKAIGGIERLDLSANRIRARGFARLAEVRFTRLRELDISGPHCSPYYFRVGEQPVRDEGMRAWAASSAMTTLESLSARSARLTDASLEALGRCTARNLAALDLAHNQFGEAGARALTASAFWPALRSFSLADCLLDDDAIAAMTTRCDAASLRSLRLGYNNIGPRGAAALAAWPALDRVLELGLHDNVLSDDGLCALAASPHLGRLVELDLEQDCWNSRAATFDRAGVELARSRSLRGLDSLFAGIVDEYHGGAYSTGFTARALAALRTSEHLRPEVRASLSSEAYEDDEENAEEPEQADTGEDGTGDELAKTLAAQRQKQDFRSHPRNVDDHPDEEP